jgi:hypothetical protein
MNKVKEILFNILVGLVLILSAGASTDPEYLYVIGMITVGLSVVCVCYFAFYHWRERERKLDWQSYKAVRIALDQAGKAIAGDEGAKIAALRQLSFHYENGDIRVLSPGQFVGDMDVVYGLAAGVLLLGGATKLVILMLS